MRRPTREQLVVSLRDAIRLAQSTSDKEVRRDPKLEVARRILYAETGEAA